MAGKYSALNDWRLGNLINGEYYCELVADMVMKSLRKCIDSSEKLMMRDENAIKSLMEGLVLTGIAMSFTGNSRPASGAEHHLSHFMEMMCMFEGKEVPLHGLKVGINTVIITKLRRLLSDMAPDFEAAAVSAAAFDKARWTGDVKRLFRQAAPGIISLNEKEKINSAEERISRLKKIKESWDKISNIMKDTPSAEEIGSLLTAAGAPVRAEELGFGKELVIDGLIYCKEIRARYTVLQLAWDLGLLEKLAQEIV
jgi:glycerol-1-phosphate dehydrogenase [NAD(P)+]